jgi:hypothetical protein
MAKKKKKASKSKSRKGAKQTASSPSKVSSKKAASDEDASLVANADEGEQESEDEASEKESVVVSGPKEEKEKAPVAPDVLPAPYSGHTDPTGGKGSYVLSSWLFFRALGVIYLIAFASAWVQIVGLVGEQGIAPVSQFFKHIERVHGSGAGWWAPTVLWWGHSDISLQLLCGVGMFLAVLLIIGFFPVLTTFLLWVSYLSLVVAGQFFFAFQWDTLLLEAGLLSIFLASWSVWPRWKATQQPPFAAILMLWLLLFRLMFFAGFSKLFSGDASWWKLTALQYHYWTQPLPSWLSWYTHQLPVWFHQFCVLAMLVIEVLVPFALLASRGPRMIAALSFIFLQIIIVMTGNYGFFNFLTIVLCLLLFDDAALRQIVPESWSQRFVVPMEELGLPLNKRLPRILFLAFFLVPLLFLTLFHESQRFQRFAQEKPKPLASMNWYEKVNYGLSRPFVAVLRATSLRNQSPSFRKSYRMWRRWHLVNRYGLFATMTKTRPELILEGSTDGKTWKEYRFVWKPGDVNQRPKLIGPHMPRLDWQMWFAALYRRPPVWLLHLTHRLLEGEPTVLRLLAENPFPKKPPTYIRVMRYRYTFASGSQADKRAWWTRKKVGLFLAPTKRAIPMKPAPSSRPAK